jgi:hypothetical protein
MKWTADDGRQTMDSGRRSVVCGLRSIVRGLRSQDQRRQGVEPEQGSGQDTGRQGIDGCG